MEPKSRPTIKIPNTPFEKLATIISLLINLINLVYIYLKWPTIPEKIPGHYNAAGEVDRWGGKEEIWLLPIISFALWLGFTILEKYPHIYNYINLTEQNAEKQYKYARLLLTTLKLEITVFFSYTSIQSIQIARGVDFGLGAWEMPLFFAVIFGTLGLYLFKVIRLK